MSIENNEKVFDEFIKSNGGVGRFDTDQLDVEAQFFFDVFKANAQQSINNHRYSRQTSALGTMPHIHFDLVDDLSLNAIAGVDKKGNEFIGVNHGTVLLLLDTFNRMLARQDILPEIGDVRLEHNPEVLPFLTTTYARIQEFYDVWDLSQVIVPVDPVRQEHAALLTEFALQFLIEHEIAHLRYGHVHYGWHITGNAFILEYDENAKNDILPITNKVLEWDADCWAANQAIYRVIQYIGSPDTFTEIKAKYENPVSGIVINWGVAIWTMFRLIDLVRTNLGMRPSVKYPEPIIRAVNALDTAAATLDTLENPVYTSKMLYDDIPKILDRAEVALYNVSSYKPDMERLKEDVIRVMSNPDTRYLPQYLEHWENVVGPSLKPFQRANDGPHKP